MVGLGRDIGSRCPVKWIRNWFSNYEKLDEPFEYKGLMFHTVETFYQCMKIPLVDKDHRRLVSSMSPAMAKRYCSKRNKNFKIRSDWEKVKIKVMNFALRKKFARGTSWYKKLKATKGEIVEVNNWHDNIWGDCVCDRCSNTTGRNLLGQLLMEIRDES